MEGGSVYVRKRDKLNYSAMYSHHPTSDIRHCPTYHDLRFIQETDSEHNKVFFFFFGRCVRLLSPLESPLVQYLGPGHRCGV